MSKPKLEQLVGNAKYELRMFVNEKIVGLGKPSRELLKSPRSNNAPFFRKEVGLTNVKDINQIFTFAKTLCN